MITRRHFLRQGIRSIVGTGFLLNSIHSLSSWAWAANRRILTKETQRDTLIHENPAALDAANLEITPLEQFGTMGPVDQVIDRDKWHLDVSGKVRRPLRLPYTELMTLPSIERSVLLICPGFFANHGRWKGVSMKELLQQADFDRKALRAVVESQDGKSATFSLADILTDKIFLAYQVNGKELPRKHGFPLRVVAEDSYGSDWLKYVNRVSVL